MKPGALHTASAGKRRARGFTPRWLATTLNLAAAKLRGLKDFLKHQTDQARRQSPASPDKRRRAKRLAD
ncbi:hypothetical protein Srot_3025 [Segniliparus rotundus DSM 44985]|uniref:Uncharacterized protein n=1 Tax=Segniliparus rotundus (strain ATCC BAA-972 / CDC 1076 / CIP 108378 / DSM 44985 / JCM 13578) TaxID=640132 RepID=D6ZEH4_SEGRD|nr:hypothetical protein Srot_3025 [Segniliparus rotundus DSM 44985]